MPEPSRLFSKKYGQVLLRNQKVARFEVSALSLPEGSSVLEIGPGPGTLTEILLESGYKVTAIEADHRFAEELAYRFRDSVETGFLKIIKGDFLKIEPEPYDGIIGNVPYQISSEIVFRLGLYSFTRAVLMFQREFCQRLVAKTDSKDYSRLSVNAQLRFRVRLIARVSRNSFYPVPEVDSAVVELIPRNEFSEESISAADVTFRKLFSSRRKKISTILKGIDQKFAEKRVGEISPEDLYEMVINYVSSRSSRQTV